MNHRVRSFRPDDADELASLVQGAILTIGRASYSEEQVRAWAARHPGAEFLRKRELEGDIILVAADDRDRPVAFVLIERNGHCDQLYCHPDHTRCGLADRLLAAAERDVRDLGAICLHAEASELARPAFERAGYRVTSRRDFTIEHEGEPVAIHNYAMEKSLR